MEDKAKGRMKEAAGAFTGDISAEMLADAGARVIKVEEPERGILFHDGTTRSMEQLMSDQAKNAMMHNLVVELLRKQYQSLENALQERVG